MDEITVDDVGSILDDLVEAYDDYAFCWKVEREARRAAYENALAMGLSASRAETAASMATTREAAEVVKVQYRIRGLEQTFEYARWVVGRGDGPGREGAGRGPGREDVTT